MDEQPLRNRMSDEREAITHRFVVGGHKGYVTVGIYEDGRPGELFIVMAKTGSTVAGLMDCFATAISIGLQYGVPLAAFVDKFVYQQFEPKGFTDHPTIREATSVMDYIFQWLALRFDIPVEKV